MKFQISIFIGLIFLLFTGCSVKPIKVVEVSESKKAIKKAQQDNVKRLDYYKSMSMISKVTLKELDELIDGKPTAAGELLVLSAEAAAKAITDELVKSFSGSVEGSLPIVAHWNTGYPEYTNGMDPDYMLSLIENGLHVLPSWHLDPYWSDSVPEAYYKASILKAAELKLPLVFITAPFEDALLQDSYYSNIIGLNNPGVIDLSGNILSKLSPFASDRNWYSVGKRWAQSEILQKIQEWYPEPPLVMFVADKKASKLIWVDAEASQRYVDSYSSNLNYKDENFKRDVIGDAWKGKYLQLKKGFERALKSRTWKNNVKFVSYNEVPVSMGEHSFWKDSATYTDERLTVWTDTADATTSEFHIDTSEGETGTDVLGPQSRANNLPFIIDETKKVNPNFALQLSISDEHVMNSSEAYRGYTQLGLWLARPSVIRESIGWSDNRDDIGPYFQEVLDSVEMIHNNELLHTFWNQGVLVANPYYDGPNDNAIPDQYVDSNRWFLLNVDKNPTQPWNIGDYIAVWAIALRLGEAPNREWLLYVQSPDGVQENISVEIPGYQDVIVDSNAEGAFYIVDEAVDSTETVLQRSVVLETDEPVADTTEPVEAPVETTIEEAVVEEVVPEPIEVVSASYVQTTLSNDAVAKNIPAFYGAEGPGAASIGGRGGRVIEVTNLENSGPGSLREAVEAVGPRIVVFKVSGIIDFDGKSLDINNPYITIAGQSAPDGGITLRGQALEVGTHDVIIRYIKMRTGIDGGGADAMSVTDGAYNVIIDHCSFSWSNDENIGLWSGSTPAHDITWSWNLISEGLMHSSASLGLLTGSNTNSNDMRDITVQHNAFINFTHRLPLIKVRTSKVINNLVYNWSEWGTGVSGGVTIDIIGNMYKAGPLTGTNLTYLRVIVVRTDQTIADEGWTGDPDFGPDGKPSIYARGNVSPRRGISEPGDDWPMISEWYWQRQWPDLDANQYRRYEEMPKYQYPITQYDVATAEEKILNDAGASKRINDDGTWVSNRDSVDLRVINDYKNDTGIIPTYENDVGGYPAIATVAGYLDSDRDGMADIWEDSHGFNKADAIDGGLDKDSDGYTNVEEFLNGSNP